MAYYKPLDSERFEKNALSSRRLHQRDSSNEGIPTSMLSMRDNVQAKRKRKLSDLLER